MEMVVTDIITHERVKENKLGENATYVLGVMSNCLKHAIYILLHCKKKFVI